MSIVRRSLRMNLICGDSIDVMAGMEPESVDAIVTDPPYMLSFMGKTWDSPTKMSGHAQPDKDVVGFYQAVGKGGTHDKGYEAWKPNLMGEWHQQWAEAAFRVAKPSAYLLAFGGTRTVHRMTCAIEDAGWIVRDMLVWAYLSGFPKSRANLKPAWEPIVLARKPGPLRPFDIEGCRIVSGPTAIMDAWENDANLCALCAEDADFPARLGAPATRASTTPRHAAPTLSGWETSTDTGRPDIGCSDGTMADDTATSSNTVASGRTPTGRSRPDTSSTTSTRTRATTDSKTCSSCGEPITRTTTSATPSAIATERLAGTTSESIESVGRWPSNVLMVEPVFEEDRPGVIGSGPGMSRVFLIPKADRADREPVLGGLPVRDSMKWRGGSEKMQGLAGTYPDGSPRPPQYRANHHPTVKPTDLMRHLVRLVTPTGGIVLDPFLGSGTTAIAAEMEGFAWIGIERELEYCQIAEARLNGVQRGLGLPA